MRPGVIAASLAVLAAASLVGCGGDDRPSDTAWGAIWESEHGLVPTETELVAGGRDLCDELVGLYRERFDELTPTPSEALDDAVDAWTDQAEQIAFVCPDDPAVLATEYDALRRLEAEIDAGLAAG